MLLRTTLCLLTFLIAAPLFAQGGTPDTTTAARYFPLDVGNAWEYQNDFDPAFERRTIAADTLINGVRFVRYQQQALDEEGNVLRTMSNAYLRYDERTTEIRYWDEGDLPPFDILAGCPLGAPFGSSGACTGLSCAVVTVNGGYEEKLAVGNDVVTTSVKIFDTQGCEVQSSFAAGVGFTERFAIGGGTALEYAHVGNQEYGEPRAVTTEPNVLVSTGLSLDIFPNPARQTSTVAVSQREVGVLVVKVYDVLGREVATLHAGSLAAGRHAFEFDVTTLPGGVYVVRAVGRERAVTQRFTVAR